MNHKKMRIMASTFIRGAKLVPPTVSGAGVLVPNIVVGVTVTVGVFVNIGKINVSAGSGARVVVGLGEGVVVGV